MILTIPKEFTGEGVYVNARAGIYAIVNPIGEIYIGYSKQLRDRIKEHKKWVAPTLKQLAKSMFKHGRKNHKFYLVKEIDEQEDVSLFRSMEMFYIDKFKKEGFALLNCNSGGCGGEKGRSHIKAGELYPLNYENSWRKPSER